MKLNLWIVFLLVLCLFSACSSTSHTEDLEEIGKQIEQALPEDYQKRSETEVYEYVFSDGNEGTIVYYLCVTTYHAANPNTVTGLDIDSISAVFDLGSAQIQKEFTVSGHPAAIYQSNDSAYLCWTSSPETSAVLEYDPDTITEEEAVRIAQSVYETPEF